MADSPADDLPETGKDRKRRADRMAELDKRLSAAREAGKPKPRADKDKYAAMSLGWRLIIELVLSMMIGAAMGWGLDWLFGSLPLFLIVFTLLGMGAGVRTMMRSHAEFQRTQGQGTPPAPKEE